MRVVGGRANDPAPELLFVSVRAILTNSRCSRVIPRAAVATAYRKIANI